MKKTRVYIAGPMTGLPNFNYDAFHAVAAELRALGYDVANPAEHFGGDQSREHDEYLREAIRAVVACDAIWTLPGWRASTGAKLEMAVARVCKLQHLNPDAQDRYTHAEVCLVPSQACTVIVDDGRAQRLPA